MKKHFIPLMFCLIGFLLYGNICQAEEPVSNIHYSLSDNGTLTISGIGSLTDRQKMENYKETTKQLIIQEGITDIQEIDFWKFTKLETIKLPNSIKVIHDEVFACCHSRSEERRVGKECRL